MQTAFIISFILHLQCPQQQVGTWYIELFNHMDKLDTAQGLCLVELVLIEFSTRIEIEDA
jgi:hypothetical protein